MVIYRTRGFRSVESEQEQKQLEGLGNIKEKVQLDWRPIPFETARMRYKFKIFSRRVGSIAKYMIAEQVPNILWNEIATVPDNCAFEEAKDKEYAYVRMTKYGIEERGARIRISRRA